MDFKTIESRSLREKVLYLRHDSGLDIYVCPKRGFSSQYAIFGTKYGSIDNVFTDGAVTTAVPEGIAHFLEHKLFESEDGDAFSRFAKTGANANAYTSFDRTCYLFSSSSGFAESLDILLDFVSHPYFSEKTVGKEQGIIGQEIRMYDDDPGWQVLFGLLSCLYTRHPVRIDIAGTTESIAKITPELLYKCYGSYYNLNNMVLCVAGDVDPQLVADAAGRNLKKAPPMTVRSVFAPEPEHIACARSVKKLPVSTPMFAFGFRCAPSEGFDAALDEVSSDILLEMLCGDSSGLYRSLYDEGLINQDFSSQYFSGRSFAAVVISGESRDPEKVADALRTGIRSMREHGMDTAEFERARRSVFGNFAAHFDSVDAIANDIAGCRFMGMGPFDFADAAAGVTPDDVMRRLGALTDDMSALSVILPV
jgi:predicted Zn-dependent peptidase